MTTLWLLALPVALAALALSAPFLIDPRPAPGLADPREAAGPESRFVEIPWPGTSGLAIRYIERGGGPGPAMLLLHGFTLDAHTWDPVLEGLGRLGRAIAYDQPPYGLSAKPRGAPPDTPHPYGRGASLDQLFAVMDALGLRRVVLVGSSSGGTLALEAALARPERVSALILVAPWVYARRPTLPAWLSALPQMRRLSLLGARKLGARTLLRHCWAKPSRIPVGRLHQAIEHTRIAGWDLAWGELLRRSLSIPVEVSTRLGSVAQPTLLVAGDADRLVPLADSRRAAAALPMAELVELQGCGHVPQEECPQAFLEAVSHWLPKALPGAA